MFQNIGILTLLLIIWSLFDNNRRFCKRHKNISVHASPAFLNIREGDIVTVGQCRPLAKTVKVIEFNHLNSLFIYNE